MTHLNLKIQKTGAMDKVFHTTRTGQVGSGQNTGYVKAISPDALRATLYLAHDDAIRHPWLSRNADHDGNLREPIYGVHF